MRFVKICRAKPTFPKSKIDVTPIPEMLMKDVICPEHILTTQIHKYINTLYKLYIALSRYNTIEEIQYVEMIKSL